jgi:hypothetical protein
MSIDVHDRAHSVRHKPVPAPGPLRRSRGVPEAPRGAGDHAAGAASRRVSDRRERDAEPHDGGGADRRLHARPRVARRPSSLPSDNGNLDFDKAAGRCGRYRGGNLRKPFLDKPPPAFAEDDEGDLSIDQILLRLRLHWPISFRISLRHFNRAVTPQSRCRSEAIELLKPADSLVPTGERRAHHRRSP